MKSPKYNAEELVNSAWVAALGDKNQAAPKGWKSLSQLKKEHGLTTNPLKERLNLLIEQGKVERRIFTMKDSLGRKCHVPHYKLT